MKHVLLTGATGFLGSHLLEALLEQGYDVTILKRSTSDTWRIELFLDQIKIYNVDEVLVSKAFAEQPIDLVLHLATLYKKYNSGADVAEMIRANVDFPMELLELAVQHNVKGFVNTGTFFESDCSKLPLRELAPDKPFNFYAVTKLAFESVLRLYATKIASITLRLFSPYGERDNDKLIPTLIQKALRNERIELSDGLQKLDFIYASDVVSAYIKAIEKFESFDSGHEVYNIGSGHGISIREIVSLLEQQLSLPIDKLWGIPETQDIPIVFADITKAKNELGWAPAYSLHEGLRETIGYYKAVI